MRGRRAAAYTAATASGSRTAGLRRRARGTSARVSTRTSAGRLRPAMSPARRTRGGGDRDGEASGGAEEPGGAGGLVAGVAQVGRRSAVDADRVAADPHAGAGVVLRVEGQHPTWSDGDVVDVAAPVPDRDRVEHVPAAAVQALETGPDDRLPLGAEPPGTLVGVHVEGAGEGGPQPGPGAGGGELLLRPQPPGVTGSARGQSSSGSPTPRPGTDMDWGPAGAVRSATAAANSCAAGSPPSGVGPGDSPRVLTPTSVPERRRPAAPLASRRLCRGPPDAHGSVLSPRNRDQEDHRGP